MIQEHLARHKHFFIDFPKGQIIFNLLHVFFQSWPVENPLPEFYDLNEDVHSAVDEISLNSCDPLAHQIIFT